MAACTFAVGTADTGTAPNTSGNFSPASGDLLVVFVGASASVDPTPALSSSIGGFTFTLVATQTQSAGTHSLWCFISDALVSNTAAQNVTITLATDNSTGTNILVYRVSGMSKTGVTALKQSAGNNGVSANAPNITFGANCDTNNPTLGAVTNLSNPAGITANASWTEPAGGDIGYTNPDFGTAVCHRDSGFASTGVTWGATSATAWGALMVELDSSAAAAATLKSRITLLGVGR